MKIVFASSEVVPYAKTGGLADVAGALPKEIRKLKHEIIVVLPLYQSINRDKYKLEMNGSLEIPILNSTKSADVYKCKLDGSQVQVYFIANAEFFDRQGLYQDGPNDYDDNDARFSFFSRAVLELCKFLDFCPDIIHCNDWQTGLIPVYLKVTYAHDPFFLRTASLFTIHNLAYQGVFDAASAIAVSDLPWEVYAYDKLEFWGKFNYLKGGLVYADLINTVSVKYSEEIQTYEYGCGLQGLLASRKSDIFGIINGIDYSVWDPSVDPHLSANYSLNDLKGKSINKKALLKQYGLKYKKTTPVFGIISRLADQKGFDLIAEVVEKMMHLNLQLVVLGTGDQKYHDLFTVLAEKYPEKIGVALRYDAMLAQTIYAGSDMFLMPSRYEPCGLGQLISLKYGTIPIVRETGGLADTIVDYDMADIFESDRSNGFVFTEYNSDKMYERILRAVEVYKDDAVWRKIMVNAMKYDYSWKVSAQRYIELYTLALTRNS